MTMTLCTCLARQMRSDNAYPPYAPFYSSTDWELHCRAAWPRLTLGKRQFDPGSVLTPGMRG